jgi:hypothetical protein
MASAVFEGSFPSDQKDNNEEEVLISDHPLLGQRAACTEGGKKVPLMLA